MAKLPTPATSPAAPVTPPTALDTLISITEEALAFRYADKPVTLLNIGKTAIAAARALYIRSAEERMATENAAVVAIAKKRQLLS